MVKKEKNLVWGRCMNDHFSPFLINSLVCFILFSVVWLCRCSVLFLIWICIVLFREAQANCPGYTALLSPKPGAILCQIVDNHSTQTLSCVRHWQVCSSIHTTQCTSPHKLCPPAFELPVLCSIGPGVGQRLENCTTVPYHAQGALLPCLCLS